MVYCGKPSKACQRCRKRKLKCDLRAESCGQCRRAKTPCSGYRDTEQLRIRDESQVVLDRVRFKAKHLLEPPRALAISVDTKARDSFFQYFVVGTSKAWDFLKPFYDSAQAPEHLTLTIDAASLAFFSYQATSNSVLATARARYVSALQETGKALQSPQIVGSDSTVFASLLLDLFEKITYQSCQEATMWVGHVAGALALVNLRGLDQFQNFSSLRSLARLTTNFVICSISSQSPVPGAVVAIRNYIANRLQIKVKDPKWRLTDIMVDFANLQYRMKSGDYSVTERIALTVELDARLQVLFRVVPPSWQYQTVIINHASERVLERLYNVYPDHHVTQTWNVLRLSRIFLNESLLEYCSLLESTGDEREILAERASTEIQILAREICASTPQYLITQSEEFSQDRRNGVYALIFPLYVAAWSRASPEPLRQWVLQQVQFIVDKLCIRNAATVVDYLERGAKISPWAVYATLGSYAFAA